MATVSAAAARTSDSLLVRAARRQPVERTPVWFMRQAGRSLPEYREAREGTPMLEACRTPDLVTEITLQPVRRHGVDAAIFFSDIVVPLAAVGVDIDIVPGTGPVVAKPIRTRADLDRLPRADAGPGAGHRRVGPPASPRRSAARRSSGSPARRSRSPPTSSRAAPAATTSTPRR